MVWETLEHEISLIPQARSLSPPISRREAVPTARRRTPSHPQRQKADRNPVLGDLAPQNPQVRIVYVSVYIYIYI